MADLLRPLHKSNLGLKLPFFRWLGFLQVAYTYSDMSTCKKPSQQKNHQFWAPKRLMQRSHVIEPSEIIIEGQGPERVQISKINPWLRFLARFFDYALFFNLLHLIFKRFFFPSYEWFFPIEFLAWIPIEAFLLWSWGSTPGKWLLRTELTKDHAKRLPFFCAFQRSVAVWFRGMGMGIPVINILCLIGAYYRLRVFQTTSWDSDEKITVIHHPLPKWRFYLVLFCASAGMIYYSFWKKSLL